MFSYLRKKWYGSSASTLESNYISTTYQSFSSILKTVGKTLTTLNPVSVTLMLGALQMFLVEAQSDDSLVLEAPSNGTLTNVTLVQNNLGMNASAFAFAGSNFSNINISDYIDLPSSLFLTVSFWAREFTQGTILAFKDFELAVNPYAFINHTSPFNCPINYFEVAQQGELVCGALNDNYPLTAPTFSLKDWTHYALAVNQNDMYFYVNGTYKSLSVATPYATNNAYTSSVLIGGNRFNGELANVLLYGSPLCTKQINAIYQSQTRFIGYDNATHVSSEICNLGNSLVLDFPGDGSTYLALLQNDLQPVANRFGTPNAAYLFKSDSYFYAADEDLPTLIPQTVSWWMRNGSAGSIISYGINVQINQQYLNNQSGSAYACPGLNGYLSIAYGPDLVCGGWLNSPLNKNIYLGYGPNNTWSQYALTLDNSNAITIYINGSVIASNLTEYSEPSSPFTAPFFTVGNQFNGALDTLRVYSRALNASEILANFKAENTSPDGNGSGFSSSGMFSSGSSTSAASNVAVSSSLSSSAVSSRVASSAASSSVSSNVASSSVSSSVSSNAASSSVSSSVTSSAASSSVSSSVSSNAASSSVSRSVTSSAASSLVSSSVTSNAASSSVSSSVSSNAASSSVSSSVSSNAASSSVSSSVSSNAASYSVSSSVTSSVVSSSISSSVSSSLVSSLVSSGASSSVTSSSASNSITSSDPSSSVSSSVTLSYPSSSTNNAATSQVASSSSTFSSILPRPDTSSHRFANTSANASNLSSRPDAVLTLLPVGLATLLMAGRTGFFARQNQRQQPKRLVSLCENPTPALKV